MKSASLCEVHVDTVDDHPGNPRLVIRDDVVDAIAANVNGGWPQQHALHLRPVGDRYQILSGHHRIRAARKKGLAAVWAWVEPMDDAAAFMLLATENNQGELSPLELGRHALMAVPLEVGGKGKKGGLADYARRVGKTQQYLVQLRQAAIVLRAVADKPTSQLVGLLDKAQHLAAIYAAPEALWPDLVRLLIERTWTAADTAYWVTQMEAFEIPGKWEGIFLEPIAVRRHFLETREFSPATVKRLVARAEVIEALIDAAEFDCDAHRAAFHDWLRAHAGAEAWDVRELERYERELRVVLERDRLAFEKAWNHGDWRTFVDAVADGTFALILTDPPYGSDYQSDYRLDRRISRKHEPIAKDADAATAADEIEAALTALYPKCTDAAHVLVFTHWRTEHEVRAAIERAGYAIRGSLVWVKHNRGMGDPTTTFAPQHERIIHAVKGSPTLFEREADVLTFNRCTTERHPTEKPVELLKRLIEVTTVAGEIVADPFGGVASTLVAARALKRGYWGCELAPDFFRCGTERLIA